MNFNYLDPATTAIAYAPDGTVRVVVPGERCGMKVDVVNAFPLSHPEEYIVLRDGGGGEVGVLRRLSDASPDVATLLRDQLRRRYFLPQITAIEKVTERFGSSIWELDTDRGRCAITTRQMNEAVFEVEPGRYLITDVAGNRYEIKDLKSLDPDSRARFMGRI